MTPVEQRLFAGVKARIPGDCFKACIASILELQYEEVPHFLLYGEQWCHVFNIWLIEKGLVCESRDAYQKKEPPKPYDGYHIVGGMGTRGHRHAVIAYKDELVFDPHPDKTFILPHSEKKSMGWIRYNITKDD